jgi:hypothetical protein
MPREKAKAPVSRGRLPRSDFRPMHPVRDLQAGLAASTLLRVRSGQELQTAQQAGASQPTRLVVWAFSSKIGLGGRQGGRSARASAFARSRRCRPPRMAVRAAREDRLWEVAVSDTRKGIQTSRFAEVASRQCRQQGGGLQVVGKEVAQEEEWAVTYPLGEVVLKVSLEVSHEVLKFRSPLRSVSVSGWSQAGDHPEAALKAKLEGLAEGLIVEKSLTADAWEYSPSRPARHLRR